MVLKISETINNKKMQHRNTHGILDKLKPLQFIGKWLILYMEASNVSLKTDYPNKNVLFYNGICLDQRSAVIGIYNKLVSLSYPNCAGSPVLQIF